MSRTFKDKPYRVLEREAMEHGYTYLRYNRMHSAEPPTLEGDVAAYAYSRGRKAHIPSGRRWHNVFCQVVIGQCGVSFPSEKAVGFSPVRNWPVIARVLLFHCIRA